jgi:putative endopeptidase
MHQFLDPREALRGPMSETDPILSAADATGAGHRAYHPAMRKIPPFLTVVFACVVPFAALGGASPAGPLRPAALEAGVDPGVRPGDDFFAWANGAWFAATEIPAGKERVSARTEIDELTRRQVARLFEDAEVAPAGTTARQVADFRAALLDEAAIERRGLAPLSPVLRRIDGVTDRASLVRLLGEGLRADVDPLNWGVYDSSHLFGLSVEIGNHGEPDYVAYLLQGGLGLPDRESYLGAEPALQALRGRYETYIGRLLTLSEAASGTETASRAAAVLALETSIARSHAARKESANDRNADHLWTRADFARRAPGIDWPAFFAAAGLAEQESWVVWQPGAVEGAAQLVASQPLTAWKDYLRVRELDRNVDLLPKAFAAAASSLREAAPAGGSDAARSARAEAAQGATLKALAEEVGAVYADRHFPAAAKARVEAIVTAVVAAFRQRVEGVTWMSPASRAIALRKLDRLEFGIGYPERRPGAAELHVDPEDAVGNFARVAARDYRRALARLGRPVDRTDWWIAPHRAGAVLLFQQNAYNFAAALLQPPKFDPAASDAMTYGAIGAIVGHEVSHFVDTLGAEYDASGAFRRWWTPADLAGYESATAPLVEQFSAYRPFPDLAIDGKRTLSENLADLGGLAAAFDAYRRTLGSKAGDPVLVRRLDREFFIGFARAWRSKIRPEAVRTQVSSDDTHAPETYRVSTVRNLDAWYEAFDVRPGDRLYLPPAQRVRAW